MIDSTSGSTSSLSTMPSISLLGNTADGKWDSFTNVQPGSYEIIAEITTGSTLGASDSDTLTITNHLPYSVYYNSANDSTNNNGDSILHLDLKPIFAPKVMAQAMMY
ncbi:MAG: hypothetical protein HWD58_20045 [Bacteroidota bacterium]|nr:MAG: hypothetical protein HWD58_20045 [Bacteroidota bacterium]